MLGVGINCSADHGTNATQREHCVRHVLHSKEEVGMITSDIKKRTKMRCKFGIVIMIIRRDTCNIRRVHVSRLAKVRERTSLYGTVKNKMLIVLIFSQGLPT